LAVFGRIFEKKKLMSTSKQKMNFEFTSGVVGYPLLFVLMIWTVFWFEIRFGYDFNTFGVYPQTWSGLRGILFSPFIHSNIEHLWHNTLPLLILSTALFYFYGVVAWRVLWYGLLLTGLTTWVLGRPSYHIGASGVIYMLFGFLFLKGIITQHFRLIALSFIVVFVYGSMVWYIAPIDPKISWEGHLSGLITGVLFAILFRQGITKPPKFDWEQPDYKETEDEFMQQFDADGNFAPLPPPKPDIDVSDDAVTVIYTFTPEEKDKEENEKD